MLNDLNSNHTKEKQTLFCCLFFCIKTTALAQLLESRGSSYETYLKNNSVMKDIGSSRIMFVKGFIYRLPHIETDRDVSNAYCRSSSGDHVDLLTRTFYTTVVVSDWCITNRAYRWWVSIQGIVGIIGGGEGTVSSAIHCGSGRLLSRLIVGIHASGISIPLSLLILLW